MDGDRRYAAGKRWSWMKPRVKLMSDSMTWMLDWMNESLQPGPMDSVHIGKVRVKMKKCSQSIAQPS